MGPEAGKLITALQEFISRIVVRSEAEVQNKIIDVNLDEGMLYASIIYAARRTDAAARLPKDIELLSNDLEDNDLHGGESNLDYEAGTSNP